MVHWISESTTPQLHILFFPIKKEPELLDVAIYGRTCKEREKDIDRIMGKQTMKKKYSNNKM